MRLPRTIPRTRPCWGVSSLLLLLACLGPPYVMISAQGGHNDMPATNFSCIGKVIGGYYADEYAGCQMFHVCTLNEKGKVHDYTFRCLAGTVFDQETRVCERADEVDCTRSESFFYLNNELYGPGIIPSTADSQGEGSSAKVQVLDPTVALMGSPEPLTPPTIPPQIPDPTTPQPVTLTPPQPSPRPIPQPQHQPRPQSRPLPPPQPFPMALPPPTSSPPPPVSPPGVTASTTRMSTSTSSSVTAAYSFPPLPFTVSRTSTSVSASSRVRIQTPLAQISLNQGIDHSILPAPHLRPSLLRLAVEAQNAAQTAKILEEHSPTSAPAITAQTPANFKDVPRLSVFHLDTSRAPPATTASFRHRQRRQLTPTSFSPSLSPDATALPLSDSTTSSRLTNTDRSRTSRGRVTSRGRTRSRQPDTSNQAAVTRQQVQQPTVTPTRNPSRGSSRSRPRIQTSSRQPTSTRQPAFRPTSTRQPTFVPTTTKRPAFRPTSIRDPAFVPTTTKQPAFKSVPEQPEVQFSFSQQFQPTTNTERPSRVTASSNTQIARRQRVGARVSPTTRPRQTSRSQQVNRPQQVRRPQPTFTPVPAVPSEVFRPPPSIITQGVFPPPHVVNQQQEFSIAQPVRPLAPPQQFRIDQPVSTQQAIRPQQQFSRPQPVTHQKAIRPQQPVIPQQPIRSQQQFSIAQPVTPKQVIRPQNEFRIEQPLGPVSRPQQALRPEQPVRPVFRPQQEFRIDQFSPIVPTFFTPEGRLSIQQRLPHSTLDFAPPTTTNPTQLPSTVQFPSDSHIRVFDAGEARQGTIGAGRTVDHTPTTTTTTTTTTPRPSFVFPETSFNCVDKIPGGLYADVETGCAVFHICSVEPDSGVKDNKFTCGPGTLFDQSTRTCQTAALVDCAAAPSLYYLNDRRNLPVHVASQPQYREQQFEFPRISSPSSSSSSSFSLPSAPSSITTTTLLVGRGRRSTDGKSVDLCRSRALGSPLADITTGCRHYTVCQASAGGGLVETRLACKKDLLFSQLQRRCVSAKKVNCAKETLSEILGLGRVSEGRRRKRRVNSLLQSHRFRRAALPPLVNLVIAPGAEDARVRRALFNLAALRQWTLENARHSTFVEVYALQTDGVDDHYPKKSYMDNTQSLDRYDINQGYQQIHRKKRDIENVTIAEQVIFGNQTKTEESSTQSSQAHMPHTGQTEPDLIVTQSFTGSLLLPTIVTKTIGQKTKVLPTSTESRHIGNSVTHPPAPVIPTTLSTFTVTRDSTSPKATTTTTQTTPPTTTVTIAAPITVTVTTTKIIKHTDTNTAADIMPTDTVDVTTSATVSPAPVATSLIASTTALPNAEEIMTSTPPTPITPMPEHSSSNPKVGDTHNESTDIQVTTTPSATSPQQITENPTTQTSTINGGELQEAPGEYGTEAPKDGVEVPKDMSTTPQPVTTTTATKNITSSVSISTTEVIPSSDNGTTPSAITSTTVPNSTTDLGQNITTVTPSNATSKFSTTESYKDITAPSGSINVSTTGAPVVTGASSNVSTTPVTESSATSPGPLSSDNLPKTNFTCKDKALEQFYPDPEVNCQVFHYCSPGFIKKQVLDLKFLCTGATMFDVNTQKCEDMASVTCEQEPTQSTINTTVTTESTTAALNETSTTEISSTSEVTITNVTEPTVVLNTTEPTNITEISSTSEVTITNATEPTVLLNTTEPTNITESINGTTEVTPVISTFDNTTESSQLNITIDTISLNETEHETINGTEIVDEIMNVTIATDEANIETTTITEDPQLPEPEVKTAEIDLPDSTTTRSTELTTETESTITEAVTEIEHDTGVKEPMVTEVPHDPTTSIATHPTEADAEPEISTELGPVMTSEVIEEKAVTEEKKTILEEVTLAPAIEVTTETSVGMTSLEPPVSVAQETTTTVSISTDVSVSSSSDSVSSETSVSSAVSVSNNATTPRNMEPLEASV